MPSEVATGGTEQNRELTVDELKRELSEAHRREVATAEVLKVISRSSFNLQEVLNSLIESAARLTGAEMGLIYRQDGEFYRAAAIYGASPEFIEVVKLNPIPPSRQSATGRAVLERRVIHIKDVIDDPEYTWAGQQGAKVRTILAVPMLREDVVVGVIVTRRTTVQPFTDKQIELLTTFADQAVIAIENTRLFEELQTRTRELQDALEYQTATSEVLGVISRSPSDLQPVLDAITATARRLGEATRASILEFKDGQFLLVSHNGPEVAGGLRSLAAKVPLGVDRGNLPGRVAIERRTVHVHDIRSDPEYTYFADRESDQRRTMLCAPLMREGELIGVFVMSRDVVRPFSQRQIELVETFADQAVIAIENARLFEAEQIRTRELTERTEELTQTLEYQTATSDVLGVISRSPNELQPVLDAMLQTAARLCQAEYALFFQLRDGKYHVVGSNNAAAELVTRLSEHPINLDRESLVGRTGLERRTVHLPDCLADPEYDRRHEQHIGKYRSMLGVPLLRDDVAIAVITLMRNDVKPFTEKQIDLVSTFADQALIAIENTRLFEEVQTRNTELRVALEQQTATSDVLKVISRSTFDLQTVLKTLVNSAGSLCQAENVQIFLRDGDVYRLEADNGFSPEYQEYVRRNPIAPSRGTLVARTALTIAPVHIPDALADPEYTWREGQRLGGFRAMLGVPLLRDGSCVGVMAMTRATPQQFTPKQIELVTTFADQAVIAIENTRLFEAEQASKHELEESLEYQTATAEVLGVISRSPTDVQPVFNTIARSAAKLCKAQFCHVFRFDGDLIHFVASHGLSPKGVEAMRTKYPIPPGRASAAARAILTATVQEIPDVDEDPEFEHGDVARLMNYRSIVAVPMTKDGRPIGAIVLVRSQAGRFLDRHIDLLKTFADQAVIAIENARLFESEQARTKELRESLEYQTATSDVLGIISRSPSELQPVFDGIVTTAQRLCEAYDASIVLRDGDRLKLKAHVGPISMRAEWPLGNRGLVASRSIMDKTTIHVHDLAAPGGEFPEGREDALKFGFRSILAVPLVLKGEGIGTMIVRRFEVRPFSDRQIALLATFADQAVIAIENTRLFEEVQARTRELTESLQQQTGTADVLKVISRSAFDLQSVLQALVESAARLCDADKGTITRQIDGVFYRAESYGFPAEVMERWRNVPVTPERGSAAGRALLEGRTVHVPDADVDPDYTFDTAGVRMRSMLGVPMLREGVPIGVLALARSDVRPFTDKQIDLVSTFADQAAIAIENVRLFEEVQARTSELAKTVEDLEVASQHKNHFVANMSHELRTPLAAILGYAELIQEGFYGALPEKSLDALTRIRSNGKHLLGLINTVLDIAKIESGQFTLNMAEYAIESVVETVRSATESLAQNKKLALTTEVAKSLPVGLGDEQRLTQVLLNLVGNAIKFTDTGEVRVSAKAVNGHFNVSVTDTGPGIPVDQRTRIFEQFHQVDSSNTKAKGGTGLGLAIAKQIIEMHGGRIWVESTLGKGSTFQMELPTRAEFQKRAP